MSNQTKHERRIVGHASGWQEQMDTCICGKAWPCAEALTSNQLSQICSCTWVEGLREPGIDCPVHPRPIGSPEELKYNG